MVISSRMVPWLRPPKVTQSWPSNTMMAINTKGRTITIQRPPGILILTCLVRMPSLRKSRTSRPPTMPADSHHGYLHQVGGGRHFACADGARRNTQQRRQVLGHDLVEDRLHPGTVADEGGKDPDHGRSEDTCGQAGDQAAGDRLAGRWPLIGSCATIRSRAKLPQPTIPERRPLPIELECRSE